MKAVSTKAREVALKVIISFALAVGMAPMAASPAHAAYSSAASPSAGQECGLLGSGDFVNILSSTEATYADCSLLEVDQSKVETCYNLMVEGIKAGQERISVNSSYQITVDDFRAAYQKISVNPELYYLGGTVSYSYRASTGYVSAIKPTYAVSTSELDSYKATFESAASTAMSWVNQSWDDFKKIQALHDYLVRNVSYSSSDAESGTHTEAHTAYGALVNKSAVCEGYALAYELLLNRLGISCVFVSSNSMNHGWNMVKLGGQWYHIDCTWDDPLPDQGFSASVSHTYFLRGDSTMKSYGYYDWTSDYTAPSDYARVAYAVYDGPASSSSSGSDGSSSGGSSSGSSSSGGSSGSDAGGNSSGSGSSGSASNGNSNGSGASGGSSSSGGGSNGSGSGGSGSSGSSSNSGGNSGSSSDSSTSDNGSSGSSEPAGTIFSDVTSGWYVECIELAYKLGYMKGYNGTTQFGPNDNLTRGQAACVYMNMADGASTSDWSGFPDVARDAYYAEAVTWARTSSVMNGYQDGRFGPDDNLTREQVACSLMNYAESIDGADVSVSDPDSVISRFADADSISDWARSAVAWAVQNGIMGNGGSLNGKGSITRAEMAAMTTNYKS